MRNLSFIDIKIKAKHYPKQSNLVFLVFFIKSSFKTSRHSTLLKASPSTCQPIFQPTGFIQLSKSVIASLAKKFLTVLTYYLSIGLSNQDWLKDISALDFSTPSFNPGPFNPRLFNHELFNHEFLSHGVEKFMVGKSGVEKSGFEMSSL